MSEDESAADSIFEVTLSPNRKLVRLRLREDASQMVLIPAESWQELIQAVKRGDLDDELPE
jgi:hypothetical protein